MIQEVHMGFVANCLFIYLFHLLKSSNYCRKKQAVPFTMFTGGIGRHAQLKQRKVPGSKGAWPQKATKVILDLVKNAESNAEAQGLEVDELNVVHAQANRAQRTRRRTYRAHGRIGPYMALPAHCEVVLAKPADRVKKAAGEQKQIKLGKRRTAQLRIVAGGGVPASN
jgi:large subunit ribosomal protein L17e